MNGLFITGTDTGIGKTVTSALVFSFLRSQGLKLGYFKPIQTGTDEDSVTVAEQTQTPLVSFPRPVYHYPEPIAPSHAAKLHGHEIQIDPIVKVWNKLDERFWIVEGAGGLLVPLNTNQTMRDLVLALNLELILVTSTRLGTINHTLLSIEAARSSNIRIAGIILVGDSDPALEETLIAHGRVSILARIPKMPKITPDLIEETSATCFNFEVWSKFITPQVHYREAASWVARDKKIIWHPYSQHGLNEEILAVESASGATLKLADGREVLDGISSWWVNIHGHAHPKIAAAIADQARKMEHVIFAGFTHEPAVTLAELLIQYPVIKEAGLTRLFYSDNGSTAVEVALKMAFQFHVNLNKESRVRFLALSNSYHGDTLGAMAVGEPEGFHKIFRTLLPQVDFIDPGNLTQLKELLTLHKNQYAAFIFEPLVQGAAGMRMYSPHFLKEAVQLCQSEGVLTICDEIFTGFYRTGKCFAFEYAEIQPDLLCLSKGITGGFLPMAVTLSSERVYQAFLSQDLRTAFLHGHSYTANPIACAAAIASWRLLQDEETQFRIQKIVEMTQFEVDSFKAHSRVKSVRNLGTIGVIEVSQSGDYFSGHLKELCRQALDRGVFLRPLGNILYVLPPYCIDESELKKIYRTIADLLLA